MNLQRLIAQPTATWLLLAVAAGGLAAAYTAQYVFGIMPCELCLWQRGPYWAGIAVALLALFGPLPFRRVMLALLVPVWLTSAGLAFYHVGVEQHWWLHDGACSNSMGMALTVESVREMLLNQPVVRCDEVNWSFLGISMPIWNAALSLAMAVFAGVAYAKNKA
jgi:disulfide bond formation protein DsbB